MLTDWQRQEVFKVIISSLEKAEKQWNEGGYQIARNQEFSEGLESGNVFDSSEPSKIPGHETVHENKTVIDEFVAFVADMRDSSQHLLCEVSQKRADVSRLQRVFYETSALLPALAFTVDINGGSVTEYLGDGVLALFRVDPGDRNASLYAAHKAACDSVDEVRTIVNLILKERYRLPELDVGVGLATSKALITLVGLPNNKHPKAFGECVFRATKLSVGRNEVIVDEYLRHSWPTSKNGTKKFTMRHLDKVIGYSSYKTPIPSFSAMESLLGSQNSESS